MKMFTTNQTPIVQFPSLKGVLNKDETLVFGFICGEMSCTCYNVITIAEEHYKKSNFLEKRKVSEIMDKFEELKLVKKVKEEAWLLSTVNIVLFISSSGFKFVKNKSDIKFIETRGCSFFHGINFEENYTEVFQFMEKEKSWENLQEFVDAWEFPFDFDAPRLDDDDCKYEFEVAKKIGVLPATYLFAALKSEEDYIHRDLIFKATAIGKETQRQIESFLQEHNIVEFSESKNEDHIIIESVDMQSMRGLNYGEK